MAWLRGLIRKFFYLLRGNPIDGHKKRGLTVGRNVSFLEDVKIDSSHCWHITIGDNVTIAPRVHILAHDASTKQYLGYTRIGNVEIADRVFIGAGSIILPGVSVGSDVIIGAGSVVSKSIPEGSVVAGNPARIVGKTDELLNRRRLERDSCPVFDRNYTLDGGITESMKDEMKNLVGGGFGYVE